jgi:hypothetical protein
VFVVIHRESALFGVEGQPELSAFEGDAVMIAQDREQNLPA